MAHWILGESRELLVSEGRDSSCAAWPHDSKGNGNIENLATIGFNYRS